MSTIKERRIQIENDYYEYVKAYRESTFMPAINELTAECQAAGHVNAETRTRPDGSQYYICDNCKKQVEIQ